LDPFEEIPSSGSQFTGLLSNVDNIYQEWSIEGQNWQDCSECDDYVKYPPALNAQNYESISSILNIVEPETKAKSKADLKKPKDNSNPNLTLNDNSHNEEGKALPKVYFGDDSNINLYYRPFEFKKGFSKEQRSRKKHQENLFEEITKPNINNLVQNSISERQLLHTNGIAERDVNTEEPIGPELDYCMCAAYRIISEYSQKRFQTENNDCEGLLWNSIYPQLPSGKPVYNASGKYAVKLFLAGKWRKVTLCSYIYVYMYIYYIHICICIYTYRYVYVYVCLVYIYMYT
jgi:hypothetical protein